MQATGVQRILSLPTMQNAFTNFAYMPDRADLSPSLARFSELSRLSLGVLILRAVVVVIEIKRDAREPALQGFLLSMALRYRAVVSQRNSREFRKLYQEIGKIGQPVCIEL